MSPHWGLWGEGTSPRGRLRLRKDGGGCGCLLHKVLVVQDWALDTVVQCQGISFRRITRTCTLRVLLFIFVRAFLSSYRRLSLFAGEASGINGLLGGIVVRFPDVVLQPFGFCRGGRANAAICIAR